MFSAFPPRLRLSVRITLTAAWLFVAGGGLSFLMVSATNTLQDIAGAAVVATAILAAYGAAFNRYRWEWVSAWFASASMVPYILSGVGDALNGDSQQLSSAFLLSALAAFFALRAQMCAAHAAKLRGQHRPQGGTGDVE